MDRPWLRSGRKRYQCRVCDGYGHNAQTCALSFGDEKLKKLKLKRKIKKPDGLCCTRCGKVGHLEPRCSRRVMAEHIESLPRQDRFRTASGAPITPPITHNQPARVSANGGGGIDWEMMALAYARMVSESQIPEGEQITLSQRSQASECGHRKPKLPGADGQSGSYRRYISPAKRKDDRWG